MSPIAERCARSPASAILRVSFAAGRLMIRKLARGTPWLIIAVLVIACGGGGGGGGGDPMPGTPPAATAPMITTQPTNVAVTVGKTATFTVVASGTDPLTYQWQKDGTAIA